MAARKAGLTPANGATPARPATARAAEEIGLGDLAAAFEVLQPQEPAVQARIARLLGLRTYPAATITPEAQPIGEGATPGPAAAPAGLPRPMAARTDGRRPRRAVAAGDRAPIRARVTPLDSAPPADLPDWLDSVEPLPAPPQAASLAPPLAPLVPPLLLRALVSDHLASPVPAGQVDVDRLVDIVARAEPIRDIPRRPVPSLRHGVQVLVDIGPGMAPFAEDQGRLLEDVRNLVGVDSLAVYWFEGCPLRGVYAAGQDAAEPYPPPLPGTTVLLLTDLGIAHTPMDIRPAQPAEWRRFARAVQEAGGRLVAFVPYSPERWPPSLHRIMTIALWDRPLKLRQFGQQPRTPQTSRPRVLARLGATAFELGKVVALAARVDRPLLRAARLALLPWADAGAEADLWFSSLVQQRSYASVLFLPEAAAALRDALRDDGKERLEAVWRFLESHRIATGAPYAIRHEETLHYIALHPDISEETRANQLLRSALKVLVEEGKTRMDVARWAQRAVPRLPESVRRLPAAQELYYTSARQLHTQPADGASLPADLEKLQWLHGSEAGRVDVGIRLAERAVTLSTVVDADMQRLSAPDGAPVLLDLRWPGVGEELSQRVSLAPGGSQVVEVAAVAAATLGRDSTVRLWDLADISQIRQWTAGQGSDDPAAFRPGDSATVVMTANLRTEPFSPGQPVGSVVATVPAGAALQLVDGPRVVAGQPWWLVDVPTEGARAQRGWLAAHTPDGTPILRPLAEPRPHKLLCLAASPDGRTLTAGSTDGAIHLWDVLTGELRGVWWDVAPGEPPQAKATPAQSVGSAAYPGPLQRSGINALAFSPDGRWLASATDQGLIHLRRAETGQVASVLEAHAGPVLAMAFGPDGRALVSCGADRQAVVWDVISGQATARFYAHESSVQAVAISPDGQVVATGSADGAVVLWQRLTAETLGSLAGVRGTVNGLAFRPDGSQLAAACAGGPLVWDVASGEVVAARTEGAEARRQLDYAVAYTPDGQHLIACGEEAAVRILAAGTLELVRSFHGLEGGGLILAVLQLPAVRITVQTSAGQRYVVEPDARRLRFEKPFDFSQRIDSGRRASHPQVDAALAVIDGWLEAADIAATEGAAEATALVVTGEPASGKATLSSSLAEIGSGLMAPPLGLGNLRPGFLSALHFCQRDDPATTDGLRFVASLASQLANRWDAYAERLYAAAGRRGHLQPVGEQTEGVEELAVRLAVGEGSSTPPIPAEEALRLYLVAPLRSLAAAGHDRPLVILVDSLHDAAKGERNILRLLPVLAELPDNVRLLFVTRETPEISTALAPLKPQQFALSPQARPAPYPSSGTAPGDSPSADDRARLVDREQERLLFDQMLQGKRRERILLLYGAPGMGKTKLLMAWRAQLQADFKIATAYVSLRELAAADELALMESVALQLGGREQFGSFYAVLEKENIELSEARRTQVQESTSQAFFGDLSLVAQDRPAAVLLLDDFEQASAGAAAWLQQRFLPWVAKARLGNLLVVIAGQSAPDAPPEMRDLAVSHELGPLSLDAVREFLAGVEAPEGIDAEMLAKLSQGQPSLIVEILDRAKAADNPLA